MLSAQRFYNNSPFEANIEIENLNILDTVVNRYRIFMTGENHSFIVDNGNIELKMLKYLNEKAGVNNLLLELGFARGYMLDKFINEDSSYFDLLKYNTGTTYLQFYKLLRAFNQSLPESKRVRVKGIDVERFSDDAPILLEKVLPKNKSVPKSIDFTIEVIKSYAKYCKIRYHRGINFNEIDDDFVNNNTISNYYSPQFKDAKVLDSILIEYYRNQIDFNQFLGSDSLLFFNIIRSIKEYRQYQAYKWMPHQYIYRERIMFQNLKVLLDENPEEKYFGQFGRCHTSLFELNEECNWWAFSSLAKRINESVFNYNILNIAIFYESEYYLNEKYSLKDSVNEQLSKYIKQSRRSDNVLYQIQETDSILKKHYQYLLLTRNKSISEDRKKELQNNVFMINFSGGFSAYNLNDFNHLVFNNNRGFESNKQNYSLGFTIKTFGFYQDMSMVINKRESIFLPNKKYIMNGYNISHSLGYSPQFSKRISAAFYFIYGFSRFSLKIKNDSLNQAISPGFSNIKEVKYINPAFLFGGGVDFRYAVSDWLGIFIRARTLYDYSKKSWKQKNGLENLNDINSPKTSLEHYHISAGISFLINTFQP